MPHPRADRHHPSPQRRCARAAPALASIANVTSGFHVPRQYADRLRRAGRRSSSFSRTSMEDNDPYGEHDFGAVYRLATGGSGRRNAPATMPTQIAATVFWKVDCYDTTPHLWQRRTLGRAADQAGADDHAGERILIVPPPPRDRAHDEAHSWKPASDLLRNHAVGKRSVDCEKEMTRWPRSTYRNAARVVSGSLELRARDA